MRTPAPGTPGEPRKLAPFLAESTAEAAARERSTGRMRKGRRSVLYCRVMASRVRSVAVTTLNLFALALALASAASCGRPTATPAPPQPDAAAQCDPMSGYATALIVDWPAAARVEVEQTVRERLAVVAYDCNGIRLLKGCRAEGTYRYGGVERKEQKLRLASADEIRAYLPFGGQRLAGDLAADLARGGALDIHITTVGYLSSTTQSARAAQLEGDCASATHVVRRVGLGAFAMERGSTDPSAAFRGGGVRPDQRYFGRDGDDQACARAEREAAAAPRECSALVSLDLAPIAGKR